MDTVRLSCLLTSTYMQVVQVIAHGRQSPPAAATARFVGQSLYALRQKPLHPLIDKTTADPNYRRYVRNRHAVSQEYDNPAPSGQASRDGRGPLPREECPAFSRREVNGGRGFAATSHTASLCATCRA